MLTRTHNVPRALIALLCLVVPLAASAASLESLVMPGPVIEGHAKIEEQCRTCHDPFDASAQPGLCLDCHKPIAKDLAAGEGFHGRHPDAKSAPCKACHTEHQGRDADITGLQPELFDHAHTDFTLEGAHAELICASCHESGARHADAPTACKGCHGKDDPHKGRLGDDCASCHQPERWDRATFDHATTDFPLSGSHAPLACQACHANSLFESAGTQCIDCHRTDDVHAGARGNACESCHTSATWSAKFDHAAKTGFALSGAHGALECRNCHVAEPEYGGLARECSACHSGDDAHLGRNGTACADCHSQQSWKVSFDHAAETGFALGGAHGALACAACHTGSLKDPLPKDCGTCHATDNPHGESLTACSDCHDDKTWSEAPRFQHDLTDFALVGMHRTASCEQCHETLAFAPLAGECRDCHSDKDAHDGAFGPACETCHNPVGWDYWQFDHGRATDFALAGAHADLVCDACHQPGSRPDQQATECVACHRVDDVHQGSFGQQCDRCHDAGSFSDPVIPDRGVSWHP